MLAEALLTCCSNSATSAKSDDCAPSADATWLAAAVSVAGPSERVLKGGSRFPSWPGEPKLTIGRSYVAPILEQLLLFRKTKGPNGGSLLAFPFGTQEACLAAADAVGLSGTGWFRLDKADPTFRK